MKNIEINFNPKSGKWEVINRKTGAVLYEYVECFDATEKAKQLMAWPEPVDDPIGKF